MEHIFLHNPVSANVGKSELLNPNRSIVQISHYEQKMSSAFSLHHAGGDGPIASWDVSPSCDFVALVRSSGAVSLLSVSPRGSINHTRTFGLRFKT